MASEYTQAVFTFERVIPLNNPKAVRGIRVTQNEETKQYAVELVKETEEKVLYTTHQWLPSVLSIVALLMAEHGIGCAWQPVQPTENV